LYVPKGRKNVLSMLDNEVSLTRNIQDRKYADRVARGLNKFILNYADGHVFFYDTDEDEFASFPYSGKDFVYHIGRDFVTKPIDNLTRKNKYLLVTMDANSCTIGELNGKSIKVVWQKQSHVPRKHDAGGQSQVRFMENRRLALLHWEKEIADVLKRMYYGGE
jgi:peptide chain release factor subunit 1